MTDLYIDKAPLVDPQNPPNPQTTSSSHTEVSNKEFLTAIFHGLEDGEKPYVVGIPAESIQSNNPPFGSGTFWDQDTAVGDSNKNWYFTLSTFLEKDGQFARKKENFHRAYGVYFDDVGTKSVSREALGACPPSYLIETSEGNYQAGYLFDKPCSSASELEELINAAAMKGFTDTGAKGPTARLGRLPNAVNGKHTPYFACKLVEWYPDRRYTIAEIMEKLDLSGSTDQAVEGKIADSSESKVKSSVVVNAIYTPKPVEHPVVSACKKLGFYKHSVGTGKHEISCPWVRQHTGEIDSGTVYFEPSAGYLCGAFKCQHGHCSDKNLGDFFNVLQVSASDARHRATIRPIDGEFDAVVDAAEMELATLGGYYQRGGVICNVVTDPANESTSIRAVNVSDLTRSLSKNVAWVSRTPTADKLIDPPAKHVKALFNSGTYKHLPSLLGIARQPYLRRDGSLMAIAGYDPVTMMFGEFEASDFSVPDYPTQNDAVAALAELKSLLKEFAFKTDDDLAAAMGLILTSSIRASLPLAPMGHIKAHQIASGKSYLCDLIAAFSGPSNAAAFAFPDNEEECSKLLLAAFFTAPSVIKFDNLVSDLLPFKSLCSAITESYLTGRVLGLSQMRTVATRSLILSSGNNVDPVADMVRRAVTITLDPGLETPATRRFEKNPLQQVLRNRAKYVSLALTIVRAFIDAGCPKQTGLAPLTSFDDWTKWVRSPLVWLGMADPAASMFASMANDPDREMLGRLLESWWVSFRDKPTSVSDIVKKCEITMASGQNTDLVESVREVGEQAGKINRRRFGRWISRHQGQIVCGRKLMRGSKQSGSERWIVSG